MYKLKILYSGEKIVGVALKIGGKSICRNILRALEGEITEIKEYDYNTIKEFRSALYEKFDLTYFLPKNIIDYLDLVVTSGLR